MKNPTPHQAAKILAEFNRWRRGDDDATQYPPALIGRAIDILIINTLSAEIEYTTDDEWPDCVYSTSLAGIDLSNEN